MHSSAAYPCVIHCKMKYFWHENFAIFCCWNNRLSVFVPKPPPNVLVEIATVHNKQPSLNQAKRVCVGGRDAGLCMALKGWPATSTTFEGLRRINGVDRSCDIFPSRMPQEEAGCTKQFVRLGTRACEVSHTKATIYVCIQVCKYVCACNRCLRFATNQPPPVFSSCNRQYPPASAETGIVSCRRRRNVRHLWWLPVFLFFSHGAATAVCISCTRATRKFEHYEIT